MSDARQTLIFPTQDMRFRRMREVVVGRRQGGRGGGRGVVRFVINLEPKN